MQVIAFALGVVVGAIGAVGLIAYWLWRYL